jgi:hypothetical protein
MVYMGGLTPDSGDPSNFLKIPNLVAAKRFGKALLDRHGLYNSVKDALYTLARTGNPMEVLAAYCRLMRQHDVTGKAFTKTEENHRDIIWVTILENPAIKPKAEYQVRKWTNKRGLSISSLQTTRITTLSSSSRTSKFPTWDSREKRISIKRNSSRRCGSTIFLS